jgi:hypothetical protein
MSFGDQLALYFFLFLFIKILTDQTWLSQILVIHAMQPDTVKGTNARAAAIEIAGEHQLKEDDNFIFLGNSEGTFDVPRGHPILPDFHSLAIEAGLVLLIGPMPRNGPKEEAKESVSNGQSNSDGSRPWI